MRARIMPRQGDITINPATGEILKAGSDGFNNSLIEGFANKIFFKAPGDPSSICDYVVDADKWNFSPKQVRKHSFSQAAEDSARAFAAKYKKLRELQNEFESLPHGKV